MCKHRVLGAPSHFCESPGIEASMDRGGRELNMWLVFMCVEQARPGAWYCALSPASEKSLFQQPQS